MHLHVVLSDPISNRDKVCIVSLTKWAANKDQSCILDQGDHPFIRQKTVVHYRDHHLYQACVVEEQLDTGEAKARPQMSEKTLQRILNGAAKSRFLPADCHKLLVEQGLIFG